MSKKKKKAPLPLLPPDVYAIDSHCHLDMGAYGEDCDDVISRALSAGVRNIMTIGIDLDSSKAALRLAQNHPSVFCSVGIHPHNVQGVTDDYYEEIVKISRHEKVKAYGEIGLDYFKGYAPKDLQIKHFKKQVSLGKELGLPLIIHDREAHDDVMEILDSFAPYPKGGVMHCFSGDIELAEEVLKLGFYISIPGVVTFNNAETIHEVVRSVPISSMIIETDGPYLSPSPYRGKRNEPAYVLYTAMKIAEIKGLPLDEVLCNTSRNTVELFGL